MFSNAFKTVYSQPAFRFHLVPLTVALRLCRKSEDGERPEPFSIGGGKAFPCVLLLCNHCLPRSTPFDDQKFPGSNLTLCAIEYGRGQTAHVPLARNGTMLAVMLQS